MLKENFKKTQKSTGLLKKNSKSKKEETADKIHVPDGLFKKCPKCNEIIYMEDILFDKLVEYGALIEE